MLKWDGSDTVSGKSPEIMSGFSGGDEWVKWEVEGRTAIERRLAR
jgi:hypothetical protein